MKRLGSIFFLCVLGIVACPSLGWSMAGPPLLTDDPDTPGSNKWEINLAVTTETSADISKLEAPLADINYGLGERFELTYEVPWVISFTPDGTTQQGLDRSLAGLKWRFADKETSGVSISVYPQITFDNPVSQNIKFQDPDVQDQTTTYLLPIEFEESFHRFEFNEEIGTQFGAGGTQYMLGLSTGYTIHDGFVLLAELHGFTMTDFSSSELILNVGGEYDLQEHFGILASFGRSLQQFDGGPSFLSFVGMQFRL